MLELKKLVVFNADVSRTDWYRKGEPPPAPKGPCDVEFHWLEPAFWQRDPSILETPGDVVSTRFSEAGRCLIARDSGGRSVYHLWLMPAGTFVAWIGKALCPPAHGMLVTDAWVDPGYRGGNVHRWGAALAVREMVRLGGKIITAGVEEHEFRTMAVMYARLGLGICVPHYYLYWLNANGALTVHWRWRPSKKLNLFSRTLEHSYGSSRIPG